MGTEDGARLRALTIDALNIPTATSGRERPESDGTITWNSTGLIVVRLTAGDTTGLGFSHAATAALGIISELLWPVIDGMDTRDTERLFWAMARAVRNTGWRGLCAAAISAVDIAVHDLAARLAEVPLTQYLGGAHDTMCPITMTIGTEGPSVSGRVAVTMCAEYSSCEATPLPGSSMAWSIR